MPKITVGIPVYNGENYLEEAVNSVLAQSYADFEVIISDNASDDRTEEICRAFEARDSRIRYVRRDVNAGLAENFNSLVALADGEYFQWLAHDDLLLPSYLDTCVRILDSRPEVFVAYARSKMLLLDGTNKDIPEASFRSDSASPHVRWNEALEQIWTTHGLLSLQYGLMRKRDLVKTRLLGDFFSSDSVFLAELALNGIFCEVSEQLFVRRLHPARLTEAYADISSRTRALGGGRNVQGVLFPHWRYLVEYGRTIARADVSVLDKAKCVPPVFKHFVRHKYRSLFGDLVRAFRMA